MVRLTRRFRGQQEGFILAQLLALITVMGILLTKAMPSVIAEGQREQEEELIFRGEALRNALRCYRAQTGTYPTRLEDLMKVRPRILRQFYRDPMTPDGAWELVTQVQPGVSGSAGGGPITAVHSRSGLSSFRGYQGKAVYSEWLFSATDDGPFLSAP